MNYSTLRRSRTYIVVPRDVPPENFLFVPETRKERRIGPGRYFIYPLALFLLTGAVLAAGGFLLNKYNAQVELVEWPDVKGSTKTFFLHNETINEQHVSPSCYQDPAGSTCTSCKPGYWHLTPTHCSPCLCSQSGSLLQACHQTTGQCQCHGGQKCDICPQGQVEQGGKCPESEVVENSDQCSQSLCSGGGSCESHDGTFTCYCMQGRTGKFCEKVVMTNDIETTGFTGQSLVVIKNTATSGPRSSLMIKFKPHRKDGVILFSSTDSDQSVGNISLFLTNGFVQFIYQEGEDNFSLLSSSSILLGQWYSLAIHTYHGDAMMQLGEEEPVVGAFKHGKIRGLGPNVNIGGVTADSPNNFHGCLADVRIGRHPVNLVSHAEPLVLRTVGLVSCEHIQCSETDSESDDNCHGETGKYRKGSLSSHSRSTTGPCHPNPCQGGGRCLRRHRDIFQCLCGVGSAGRLCETSLADVMMADEAHLKDGVVDDRMVFDGRRLVTIMNRGERKVFSERVNEFEFEIRAGGENGVLVSSRSHEKGFAKDMFEISLVNGKLEVKVKIGSDGGVGVSRKRINTGYWKKVWVGRKGRRVLVKIVGDESFSFNVGDNKENKMGRKSIKSDGYIWIGGRDPKVAQPGDRFQGEIRNFRVREKPVNLEVGK